MLRCPRGLARPDVDAGLDKLEAVGMARHVGVCDRELAPGDGRFVQLPPRNHRAETTRSCLAAGILMLTYLPPATCGVVCTSMTLPLNDPGSAVPAICRHTAIGTITDSIL